MICRLSGTDVTIVTGYTIVNHARMVKDCPGKGNCTEVTVSAVLVVGSSRYVIERLARADHVVVASRATISDTSMIIGAGGKSARGMANLAILGGRHVIERFSARVNRAEGIAMAGIAACGQHRRVGVVGTERGTEFIGVMAAAAIGGGDHVRWHCE